MVRPILSRSSATSILFRSSRNSWAFRRTPCLPILEKALTFLYGFIADLVAECRRDASQDDFLGALIALKDGGEDLTETELA